jgi:hypothetical protein
VADSIPELITQSIVTSLNGKSITVNGVSKTITCERERIVNIVEGRYPFAVVREPHIDKTQRAHRVYACKAWYQIEIEDNTVNDDYSPDETVVPIGKIYGNFNSDIMKLIASNNTRGGIALLTEFETADIYFDNERGVPIARSLVEVSVNFMVNENDFYITGG